MKTCLIAIIAIISFMATGCSTITNGGARRIEIRSDPEGAEFTIVKKDDPLGSVLFTGTTPATVTLPTKAGYFRGQSYTLRLEHAGYEPTRVEIKPKLSDSYYVNVYAMFFWVGFIGAFAVDPATGAMWDLSPGYINQTLTPTPAQAELLAARAAREAELRRAREILYNTRADDETARDTSPGRTAGADSEGTVSDTSEDTKTFGIGSDRTFYNISGGRQQIGRMGEDGSIYDGSNQIGSIRSDGQVYRGLDQIGYVSDDGTVYERGNQIGSIRSGGQVFRGHDQIGYVSEDGTVYNTAGSSISQVGRVTPGDLKAIAYFFFFLK